MIKLFKYFFLLSFSIGFINADTLQFVQSFGKFSNAVSITAAREEFIFVADKNENKIYKFDAEGKDISSFGNAGMGNNEFNQPLSIDASSGLDLLICDYRNNRIQKFDFKFSFIASFDFNVYNLTAEPSKQIFYPSGLVMLPSSEIFVLCDAGNYRCAKLKAFDEVSFLFGNTGSGMDKLNNPKKIIASSKLDLWILDSGTDEIIHFNNFGSVINRLKNPSEKPINSIAFFGEDLYIAVENLLFIYSVSKSQFIAKHIWVVSDVNTIQDICFFNKGNLLILSKKNVLKYKLLIN